MGAVVLGGAAIVAAAWLGIELAALTTTGSTGQFTRLVAVAAVVGRRPQE